MPASRSLQLALAFAIVYVVWGSTYLAIRIGVMALPPALFSGVRFVLAGVLMLVYARYRGAQWPASARDWRALAIIGTLTLVGGNGLVTYAEQWIQSNLAALIVATSALWIAWMGTWGAQGERPGRLTVLGLALGFAGVAALVGNGISLHTAPLSAYVAILSAPICWSAGSIGARRAPVSCAPAMAAALQMLFAGIVLCVIGVAAGETSRWRWDERALVSLAYLTVFGSCLAYGAYFWLVHEVPPAQLGTYAYVNPAIAVVLGWWWLDEHLDASQAVGTAIILGGVLLVTWGSRKLKPVPVSPRAQRGVS